MKTQLLALILICSNAWAYLPTLPNMLKEILEGRNDKPSYLQLRHRVRISGEQFTEIDEQIFHERGKTLFAWKTGGKSFSGLRTREGYALDSDQRFASRSSVFLKYLLSGSSEELLNLLIAEGFVRQAQIQSWKAGFAFEGDPSTWNLKENFLIQPDIFLSRLTTDVAIAVVGSRTENSSRMVYFDDELHGLRRLEWREGPKIMAWNFQHFTQMKNLGHFPKLMSFEVDGQILVDTSLVSVLTPASRKPPSFTRSNNSPGGNDESHLGMLLGYR